MNPKENSTERDARVMRLYEQLLEIEQRLIPTGLHVFGRASELQEKADLLRMVASFDRPEHGARALARLIAEALGVDSYDALLHETSAGETRELIDGIVAEAVHRFCEDGVDTAVDWLNSKAGVDGEESRPTFLLLTRVAEQLDSNNEIDSLVRALRGEFIRPGPGADIVQNPLVLPTGRNTHAVNPYSVPSQMACARAQHTADALLRRYFDEHGRYPRALALVLWGLDNIKTQGEGVAQALWLLGVRPVRDALNRATEIEVIPLEELNRPRIDVVMTVSGIFRDLSPVDDPGVRDHHIDPAERVDQPRDDLPHRRRVADIDRECEGLRAELPGLVHHLMGQRGLFRIREIVDAHRCTLPGQRQRDLPPDPSARAGHQRHLAVHSARFHVAPLGDAARLSTALSPSR